MTIEKQLKTVRIIAISLLLLTALNALIAGILFVIDPSGQEMGMSVSYLADSPFPNFLVPGLILLVVNGLLNLVATIACIGRTKHYPLLVVLQGILLSGWIAIQVILVNDLNVLHVLMFLIGMILAGCGIILRNRYKKYGQ